MHRFNIYLIIAAVIVFSFNDTFSQNKKVRKSLKAAVEQTIGSDTKIRIEYSRPAVKGRKIWGELVPYGLNEGNKYSDNKPYPWRIGANENTTFEVSKNIKVESKTLPAGKYGLHAIPGRDNWTIIFSKNDTLWGSYQYNEADDALRISVNPEEINFTEWLTFGFENLEGEKAKVFFAWEKLKVPFNIETEE